MGYYPTIPQRTAFYQPHLMRQWGPAQGPMMGGPMNYQLMPIPPRGGGRGGAVRGGRGGGPSGRGGKQPQQMNGGPPIDQRQYAQPQQRQPPPQQEAQAEMDRLTTSRLASAPENQRKQMIGERLFPLVKVLQPQIAGKITGMLLEMDNGELLHLLENNVALKDKVDEALQVLQDFAAQEGGRQGQ